MALLRLNIPGIVLYGGSILPGRYQGHDITIQDVFEAVGANAAGRISDQELLEIENTRLPGRRSVRRPVHGQHDGHGDGVDWLRPWERLLSRRWTRARTRSASVAADVMDAWEK